ncbi:uncharacterized protein LOC126824713 [Patella vulgata]|uniref:uncharacterized protein LOC126824713 n=1 Tax=Patella vulgata TaxID=6465 RepID=UPI00217F5620|nr:uncharacterized protein LOC126824713 [Patella vulgata]XP_050410015.1 uncharacterized protein LOC126824713 [Patella vulgata]
MEVFTNKDAMLSWCIVILCAVNAVFSSLQSEMSSESISFKFYNLKENEWTEDNTVKFTDILTTESNTYCSVMPSDCGLTYWNQSYIFNQSNIVVVNGYPKTDGSDLEIQFYILLPGNANISSSSSTSHVLNKMAATSILTTSKAKLESAIGEPITYIGEEFYGIPIDHATNNIMIPLAFIILFIVAVVAIGLTVWSTRKEKQRRKSNIKKKHVSTKVAPTQPKSQLTNGHHANNKGISNHNQETENNLMNTGNHEEKKMEQKNMSPMTQQSLNEFSDEAHIINEIQHKHNELPPLDTATNGQDQDQKKEKHRKKKKTKRKHRRERDGYDNSGLDESEVENQIPNHKIMTVQSDNIITEETSM